MSNVVFNPTAGSFGLQAWEASRTTVAKGGTDSNVSHFRIEQKGYMKQTIPKVRLDGLTPIDFVFRFDFQVDNEVKTTHTEAYAELLFTYSDKRTQAFMFPCKNQKLHWTTFEMTVETLEIEGVGDLQEITVAFYAHEHPGGLRIDNVQLLPNKISRNAQIENPSNGFGDFSNKAILFGLEADLPSLR